MKKTFYILLIFNTIFYSCNSEKSTEKKFIIILNEDISSIPIDKSIPITLKSTENIVVDSISCKIDQVNIPVFTKKSNCFEISISKLQLGNKSIEILIFYNGEIETHSKTFTLVSDIIPLYKGFSTKNTYNHDIEAYTQGLEFDGNSLYESTGLRGKSTIRIVDYKNATISKKQAIAEEYFGEGITIIGNKLYEITWQEHTGFVYDKNTFAQIGTFSYSTEGWGLCNDGKNLIMSDGTEFIYFYDPATFALLHRIAVYDNAGAINRLNELEFVDGFIYANIYTTDFIIKIDANSGKVIERYNLKDILAENLKHENIDVLNGIAYNKENKTFFITGKNWPRMFEGNFN